MYCNASLVLLEFGDLLRWDACKMLAGRVAIKVRMGDVFIDVDMGELIQCSR